MIKERKFEEFKTDDGKWKIGFDLENDNNQRGDITISVRFVLNHDERRYLYAEEIEKVKTRFKGFGKIQNN